MRRFTPPVPSAAIDNSGFVGMANKAQKADESLI
jgi:hypothetical protein